MIHTWGDCGRVEAENRNVALSIQGGNVDDTIVDGYVVVAISRDKVSATGQGVNTEGMVGEKVSLLVGHHHLSAIIEVGAWTIVVNVMNFIDFVLMNLIIIFEDLMQEILWPSSWGESMAPSKWNWSMGDLRGMVQHQCVVGWQKLASWMLRSGLSTRGVSSRMTSLLEGILVMLTLIACMPNWSSDSKSLGRLSSSEGGMQEWRAGGSLTVNEVIVNCLNNERLKRGKLGTG
jgi:hypothetical protein